MKPISFIFSRPENKTTVFETLIIFTYLNEFLLFLLHLPELLLSVLALQMIVRLILFLPDKRFDRKRGVILTELLILFLSQIKDFTENAE